MFRLGRLGPVLLLAPLALGLAACVETTQRDEYVWGRPGPVYSSPPPAWYGGGYGHGHGRPAWVRNGRCEDERYQTSSGGGAPEGQDEYDCLLFGNGLKSGRVKNEGEFARNGVCDDPNYIVSTGRARRGTDEYDCTRLGQGLRGKHSRGGYPAYLPSTEQPRPRVDRPRAEPPPTAEPERPEYRGRNVVIERAPEDTGRARAEADAQADAIRQAEAAREAEAMRQAEAMRAAQMEAERQAMAAEQDRRRQEAEERQRQAEEMERQRQAAEEIERQRREAEARSEDRRDVEVLGRGIVRQQ